ncbi:hypothetical protein NC653_015115 [Populus alba x Populus x berolinensis]|uniref:Uncharacterized protein n=1 Tax=Populus alba x Populus x berolinensis TaxID=444605 RepID=A0AAD6QZ37_9ROSI|nr:hypothetical protein NC653_015115 [Populus alba x Populus x berolinensis]
MTLNELTHGLKEKLPPTDSRLRPDQRYLENGEFDMANSEKLRIRATPEICRRGAGNHGGLQRIKEVIHTVMFGGYWEARGWGNWDSCPDIFGQIPTDQLFD